MPTEVKDVFPWIWYVGHTDQAVAEIVGSDIRSIQHRWRAARKYLTDNVDEFLLLG